MDLRKRRKSNEMNLQEMSEQERFELINKVRTRLRERAAEAKLWRSFLEAEELVINGDIVYESSRPLEGLSSSDMFR